MPTIKSSADLRNNYNEISTYCHNYPEPVFITKNGKGDLAVMSIEAYEELTSRFELYSQIKEGMDDIAAGNTRPFQEAMADIRSRRRRQDKDDIHLLVFVYGIKRKIIVYHNKSNSPPSQHGIIHQL